ncbi:unnamed protein product, partial [Symbiodinium sp. KB8]
MLLWVCAAQFHFAYAVPSNAGEPLPDWFANAAPGAAKRATSFPGKYRIGVVQLTGGTSLSIFSDCQSALSIAKGETAVSTDGVAQVLGHVAGCCRDVAFEGPHLLYVPGHQGATGNELADKLAKAAAAGHAAGRIAWNRPGDPDWWHHNGVKWAWAGVVTRWSKGDDALPSPVDADLSANRHHGDHEQEDFLAPFLPSPAVASGEFRVVGTCHLESYSIRALMDLCTAPQRSFDPTRLCLLAAFVEVDLDVKAIANPVNQVTEYLQTSLSRHFPKPKKVPTHPYLSEIAWELQHQESGEIGMPCAVITTPAQRGPPLGSETRRFTADLADDIQANRANAFQAANMLLARRRKKPFAPNVLPGIEDSNGQLCHTPEDTTRRWREFFSAMEDGIEVSSTQLVRETLDEAPSCWPCPESMSVIPTPLALRNAVLFAKRGKACGPDALPAEIGLSCAEEMQQILFPLALKLGLLGEEGIGHKSGGLTWLYKGRGPHTDCSSYRGILLLSTLGKALHRAYRPQIQEFFEQSAAPTQLGGRRGGSVLFGSHAMRSVLRSALAAGRTTVIIFADVAAAYYSTVRSLASRHPELEPTNKDGQSESGGACPDLSFEGQIEAPSAMLQSGAGSWLRALTATINAGTWMTLRDDDRIIRTRRGTRPGSSWADLTFGVIIRRILGLRDASRTRLQVRAAGSLFREARDPGGAIKAELRQRRTAAWTAFREGRTRLFRCQRVSLQRRGTLLSSLVLSKLFFGAGAWPPLNQADKRIIDGAVFSLYRATLGIKYGEDQHISLATACALLNLPDGDTTIIVDRLRYLKQLCRFAPDAVWAAIRRDEPYLDAMRQALRWLYIRIHATSELPDPLESWDPWCHLIRTRPSLFKGLIQRARGLELCRITCFAAMQAVHRAFLEHGEGQRIDHNGASGCSYTDARMWGSFSLPEGTSVPEIHDCLPPPTLEGLLEAQHEEYDPAVVNRGLLETLESLVRPDAEQVWTLVSDYIEPLSVLRETIRTWAHRAHEMPGVDEAAQDALLMLDPDLICETFCRPKEEAAPSVCCGDLPGPLSVTFPFVLSGEEIRFDLAEPPCPSFCYPFLGGAPLAAAKRQADLVESELLRRLNPSLRGWLQAPGSIGTLADRQKAAAKMEVVARDGTEAEIQEAILEAIDVGLEDGFVVAETALAKRTRGEEGCAMSSLLTGLHAVVLFIVEVAAMEVVVVSAEQDGLNG